MIHDDTTADETVDDIRAQVHTTVDQLSDEALVRLSRVLQDWMQIRGDPQRLGG